MRKVNIYPRNSENDIKKRVLLLKNRLVENSRLSNEKLTNSITKFSRYAANNESKLQKLSTTLGALSDKRTALRDEALTVEAKIHAARSTYSGLQNKVNNYKNNLTYAKLTERQNNIILEEDFISDELLAATTIGLKRVEHFLNPTVPVTVSKNFLSFQTRNIQIRDIDGKPIPYNFGEFRVELRTEKNDMGGSEIMISTTNAGPCPLEYSHPHINYNHTPCLGKITLLNGDPTRVIDYIKTRLMPNYLIVEIIALFQEFFTTYVHDDAYSSLKAWIGPNRWDNWRDVCHACKGLVGHTDTSFTPKCGCIKDRYGQIVQSKEELAPCGYTWNYCLTNHQNCYRSYRSP